MYRPFTKIQFNFKKYLQNHWFYIIKQTYLFFSNKNKPQYKKPKYIKKVTNTYNKDNNIFKT